LHTPERRDEGEDRPASRHEEDDPKRRRAALPAPNSRPADEDEEDADEDAEEEEEGGEEGDEEEPRRRPAPRAHHDDEDGEEEEDDEDEDEGGDRNSHRGDDDDGDDGDDEDDEPGDDEKPAPAGAARPLPAVLRPGGVIDEALRAAEGKNKVDPELLQAVVSDLAGIRDYQALVNLSAQADDDEVETAVWDALSAEPDDADWVLRFCVAREAGLATGEFEEAALTAYSRRRSAYRRILGASLLAGLDEWCYRANSNLTAADDWAVFQERWHARREQAAPGLLTGMQAFDAMTGGLRGTTLLAGLTGAGKTTFGLNLAAGVVRHTPGAGVVFVALEMPKDLILAKLLSLEAGVDYRTLAAKERPADAEEAVRAAQERLRAEVLPSLRVVDRLAGADARQDPLKALQRTAADFFRRTGLAVGLIVVDGLQRLPPPRPLVGISQDGTREYASMTNLEADEARMALLQRLQGSTRSADRPDGFAVLGVTRVNKVEPGRRLTLNDVPGPADVVFMASAVLLLEPAPQPPNGADVTPTLLNVAKVRDGGRRGDIHLDFHHTVSHFTERAGPPAGARAPAPEGKGPGAGKQARFRGN
jgi:hypothetical protein